MIKDLNNNPKIGIYSSDFTGKKEFNNTYTALDNTYSSSKTILMPRFHTWFCIYKRELLMSQELVMSRTPLRISFVGGGSDFSSYYKKVGYGCVISSTIDKNVYIVLHNRYDKLIRASYSKTE